MTALEVYRREFWTDGVFVWSSNGVMALMVADDVENFEQIMERVCNLLNEKVTTSKTPELTYDAPEILLNGKPSLIVRGWGHLTGVGGLNLPEEEAAKIQDEFAAWVISKLTGK